MSLRIVHISTLPPTQCGIAEYTAALTQNIADLHLGVGQEYVRIIRNETIDKMQITAFIPQIDIDPSDASNFHVLKTCLLGNNDQVISLQHEFKLFGGAQGEKI